MSAKKNPLISIIVPVYNAEKWVAVCIESLIGQSYDSMEILLIDDGSTDRSHELCQSYAEKDARIRLFSQENGGVSSARNCGLRVASGTYILFVDSDDLLQPDTVRIIADFQEKKDRDLVLFQAGRKQGAESIDDACTFDSSDKDVLADKVSQLLFQNQLNTVWGKVFKKALITQYDIFFDEDMCFGEDTLFTYQYISHIDSLAVLNKHGYVYRYGLNPNCLSSIVGPEKYTMLKKLDATLYRYVTGGSPNFAKSEAARETMRATHMASYVLDLFERMKHLPFREQKEEIRQFFALEECYDIKILQKFYLKVMATLSNRNRASWLLLSLLSRCRAVKRAFMRKTGRDESN